MVRIRFGWQCLGKVPDRKSVLVNLRKLLCFDRVGKFLMVLVDFLQNPIQCVGDLDFLPVFLVFLVVLALGRDFAFSAD